MFRYNSAKCSISIWVLMASNEIPLQAEKNVRGINFSFTSNEDYRKECDLLRSRYQKTKPMSGTRTLHAFISVSKYQALVEAVPFQLKHGLGCALDENASTVGVGRGPSGAPCYAVVHCQSRKHIAAGIAVFRVKNCLY